MAAVGLSQIDAAIEEAFYYSFAVYNLARTRWNATANPSSPLQMPVNFLGHRRRFVRLVMETCKSLILPTVSFYKNIRKVFLLQDTAL